MGAGPYSLDIAAGGFSRNVSWGQDLCSHTRPCASRGPGPGLTLCHHHREMTYKFEQAALHFHFARGLTNDVAVWG